jgi:hypothetical protein
MVEQRDWPGASGTDYLFDMHPVGASFDKQRGVYVFVRRTVAGLWQVLYVGETEDFDASLNGGLENLEAWPRIRDFFATHIGILPVADDAERQRIETDLREGMQPPCN